jgi:hypothetical protein
MQERSWTDLLSNRTMVRGYWRPKEVFSAALGIYPNYAFPQFLHELTHHWCFQSPVGLAIALLQLEAAAIMVRGELSQADRDRARDCIFRACAATTLLRPIAEGMALFGEFDLMVTSHGEVASAPVLAISSMFRSDVRITFHHSASSSKGVDEATQNRLRAASILAAPFYGLRTSPRLLDRKSSLLSSALSIDGDAYLLGYLIIKSMWVSSFSRFWRMFDTDLFQTVLRGFLFGDSWLALKLLDYSPAFQRTVEEIRHTVKEIACHIEGRLFEFHKCPIEFMAAQYEVENKSLKYGRVGSMFEVERVPWETDTLVQAAARAVSMSIDRLHKLASNESGRMFVDLAESLTAQRVAMQVLTIDAELERRSDGTVTVTHGGLPVHTLRADAKGWQVPDRAAGRFSIHIVPTTGYQFCLFRIPEPRIILFDTLSRGGMKSEDLEGLKSVCRTIGANDDTIELCHVAFERAIKYCDVDWVKTEQALREAALPAYSRLALAFSHNHATVQLKMREAGFWSLFDGDTSAVERLARLSCWSSLCLSRDALDQLCRSHGFTLTEASEHLLRYCDSVGFRFFALGSDTRPICLA